MKKWVLAGLVLVMIVLHQDFWNWNRAEPLAFGFLPVGLTYHLFYAIACSVLMAILVAADWPEHLETVRPETPEGLKAAEDDAEAEESR